MNEIGKGRADQTHHTGNDILVEFLGEREIGLGYGSVGILLRLRGG